MLITGHGLLMLAEVVVGVPDAVQRLGLAVAMAELTEHAQRPLAVAEGLGMVSQVSVVPADVVERAGPQHRAAARLGQARDRLA